MTRTAARKLFLFSASYGVSCVLLLLLALLTLLGTLEQVHQGLYAVQKKYFESLFLVHSFWGVVPVPLPGAFLLMVLLSINLVCGGIIRAAKGWRHWGILVVHLGILGLLAGALVSHQVSKRGHVTLYEGESAASFTSYEEWEVAITPIRDAPRVTEYLIPVSDFSSMGETGRVVYCNDDLPFDLELRTYLANSDVETVGERNQGMRETVDGFYLQRLPRENETERNVPGVYARVREETGGTQDGLLWGMMRFPWVVETDHGAWAIDFRRRSWPLPVTVRLDDFVMETYPGTRIPKAFISHITETEKGVARQAVVKMNEPFRHGHYTLYQASWGPQNAAPGQPLFSSLAVVWNPVEDVPLYTCSIICAGLVFHFIGKLLQYLRKESRRRAACATAEFPS